MRPKLAPSKPPFGRPNGAELEAGRLAQSEDFEDGQVDVADARTEDVGEGAADIAEGVKCGR